MKIAVYKNTTLLGYLLVNGNQMPSLDRMIWTLHQKGVKGWTHYEEAAE